MVLYFHERILATLIKDDTFALPFWNWDAASGYTIPPLYVDAQSSLYDANHNPLHKPPIVVNLNYNFTEESGLSAAAQLAANNTLMYRQMVKTPSLFFGQPYRQGIVSQVLYLLRPACQRQGLCIWVMLRA